MKKIALLCVMASVFAVPCFAQNMLLLGGEYNLTNPQFWSAGMGFNLKILKEYFQNDLSLNFGAIRVNDPAKNMWAYDTKNTANQQFLFYVKDNVYFCLDGKWVGMRAGVFASMGIYDVPDYKTEADLFFNGGGFAGICILPRSLIGITIDAAPGYAIAFRVGKVLGINAGGFSLPLSVGIRLNLDKW